MHRPVLLGALLAFVLCSCGAKTDAPATGPTRPGSPTPTAAGTGEPVDLANQFCPVMKVAKGKDEETKPDVFVIHDGKKVRFCCKDCIPAFREDPARYMAVLPPLRGR